MARAVRLLDLIVSRPSITDFTKVEKDIRKWAHHQRTLAKEAHGFVLQSLGNEARYDETLQRVRTSLVNIVGMASASGPFPKDVGHAQADYVGSGRRNGVREARLTRRPVRCR